MPLSLSQLFEHHQSEYSSKPKTEEFQELDDDGGNIIDDKSSIKRFGIDSEKSKRMEPSPANKITRKQSQKRKRPPVPSVAHSDDLKQQLTTRKKRIKTESSHEIDTEIEREIIDIEYDDEQEDEEEDHDVGVGVIDSTNNHRFYENYSRNTKAIYNFQKDNSEQPSHSETLEVLDSALFPSKSKGALAIGNERRLAGDYDNEGDDDGYPSKSLSGRYRPRKRRIITKISSGKKDVSYRLETQVEVQARVQRMEEYTERSAIRMRWKERAVNFQSEEDIGDAFLLRAQQNVGEKLRAAEKERRTRDRKERKIQRRKRKKEEFEKMKELERSDLLEEDDEVKEQSQLLAQLSQHDTMLKEEGENLAHPTSGPTSNIPPQKLNYWQLGYVMPKETSISYDFDPSVEKMVQSGSKGYLETDLNHYEDNRHNNDETKASFSYLMTNKNGQVSSSRLFFKANRTLISNGNSIFRPGYQSGHIHHMLSMATRSLCSSGGSGSKDEIGLENHYLRLLCLRYEDSAVKHGFDSTICADFRKSGYLTALAEDQGKNMLLYLQNTWDDPTEVAKQLGILDIFQESPIRGNLLTNLKLHSKNNRSHIKKLHKIRSINWDHDNNNDAHHEDFDEEISIPSSDKIISEGTTNGGVVDAMTIGTYLTIDEKRNFAPSKDARDAFISPNSLYTHIAGTSPPIPQYPLYPSAWIFGPVDRHSKFYHISVRMDSSIYKVMVSTLVKRIGLGRISENEPISCDTQEQILNLIEEFANINENKFYLRYTNAIQDPLDSDIPLVEFYRGVTGYCTWMANGYLEMHQSAKSPDKNEINSPRHKHDDSQQATGMSLIAGKIWDFCRPKIRRNALMRFPKLRITFGVALICRSLNPSASEILSRPIDNDGICTPLDLFKQTLEYLESKKYIATNRNFEDSSIRAAELEFLLHDAAEFFQEAIELDPTNVDYQIWHIGCLASCLLISSGNKISDSVHIYPSQIKGTFLNYETVAHEVRPCMKKYKEVRIELSTAVRALFTLAKYQDSPKAHFAVFSLLEWGQVIGLLVGTQLDEFLNDISGLHSFHFGVWSQHEPVRFFREYKGITGNNCITSLYAQILENFPGDIKNWRNLVRCLGPFSNAKNHDWWGNDRRWWGDGLLHILTPNACNRVLTKAESFVLKKKLRHLNSAMSDSLFLTHSSSITGRTHVKYKDRGGDQNLDWLPTRESLMVQNGDQGNICKEKRSRCYANDVPRTKKNISCDKNDHASSYLSSIPIPSSEDSPFQDLSSLLQEVQAYKIFIFCHLFGIGHPFVRKYIYYNLFCNCIRYKNIETIHENCDEYRVLVWLSSMGINIEHIIEVVETGLRSHDKE